jgi:transcription initiation factor TFIIIB Brf1 subunit/transcription initiation factor TFIIB
MLVKGLIQISDLEFNEMMEERKTSIAKQIINSIKEANKHPISTAAAAAIIFYWSANTVSRRVMLYPIKIIL